MPGGEVARDPPEVVRDRPGRAEAGPAAAEADVEAPAQHEIGPPERNRRHGDHRERHEPSTPLLAAQRDVQRLRRDDEHCVRMARECCKQRDAPKRKPSPTAASEGAEQCDERQRAREQEQRVHPAVDPVEEEHPGAAGEDRRDEADGPIRKSRPEHRDSRHARNREDDRHDTESGEASAEVHDEPRKEEMERGAAALCDHLVHHGGECAAADEERKRLVLVWRPGMNEESEHPRNGRSHQRDTDRERTRRELARRCTRKCTTP